MQVLDARNRIIGVEHPETINAMENLVSLYKNLGNPHKQARRGFFPSTNQDLSYILMTGSRYHCIAHSDTMKDLLAGHFQIHCSFLGGSGKFSIRLKFRQWPNFLLDQCALNADGTLKDASKIEFFNDVDDTIPIISTSRTSGMHLFLVLPVNSDRRVSCAGRSHDKAQMTEIIDAELDTMEDDAKVVPPVRKRKRKAKTKETQSDKEDDNFIESSGDSDPTLDGDSVEITLKEVSVS